MASKEGTLRKVLTGKMTRAYSEDSGVSRMGLVQARVIKIMRDLSQFLLYKTCKLWGNWALGAQVITCQRDGDRKVL